MVIGVCNWVVGQLAENKIYGEGARELQMNRSAMELRSMHKQAMLPICLVQLRPPIMLVLIDSACEPSLGRERSFAAEILDMRIHLLKWAVGC
jgi:hypothetical protein